MTLEASLLIPWVIFLYIFLFYMSFFLYNRCVLFQDAYMLCFQGSTQKDGACLEQINSRMEEQFGKKYLGIRKVEGKAGQTGRKVWVSASCSMQRPFRSFSGVQQDHEWQIDIRVEAQVINPVNIIRKCRMAQKIIGG